MFVLASFMAIGDASALDRAISGLWHQPTQDGHGFEVSVVAPGTATVTWYTYDPFGVPLWVAGLLTETSPNVLQGDLTYFQGMRFGSFDPAQVRTLRWGTLRFEILGGSCDRAQVSYASDLSYPTGERFGQGTIALQKLAGIDGVVCGQSSGGNGGTVVVAAGVTAVLDGNGTAIGRLNFRADCRIDATSLTGFVFGIECDGRLSENPLPGGTGGIVWTSADCNDGSAVIRSRQTGIVFRAFDEKIREYRVVGIEPTAAPVANGTQLYSFGFSSRQCQRYEVVGSTGSAFFPVQSATVTRHGVTQAAFQLPIRLQQGG